MVDQDGNPTDADTGVQAMREDFLNFISTTIGRYCLAGEQIEKAARSYAESDSEAAASFESWEESLESNQQGSPLSGSEAEELAEATDRTSEPGTQPEAAEGEPEIAYDPEGWDHPAPEPQQGTA